MSRLVLSNAKILDINAGIYTENQSIAMKDGKIAWLGDEGSFEKEEGDNIIDVTNKSVIPGMIDCHVHLEGTGTVNYWKEDLNTPSQKLTFIALENAQRHVISGFTTVRDAGTFANSFPAVKNAMIEMQFAGSRILGSHHFLHQKGRQEDETPDHYDRSHFGAESGPIGMRTAVRKRISNGADWIKIEATGGVLHGKNSNLEQSFFADDELDAIVSETHRMNRYVLAHCHGDEGIYRSTKAGVDTIEHGTFISEETANLMIERKNAIVATKIAVESLAKPEVFAEMTPGIQNRIREASASMRKNHKIAFDKGVRFALGTDAATPANFHGTGAKEIEYMRDHLEVSNLRALQFATIDAASAIKQLDFLGSIEVGKAADLVVVDGDPIQDVTILQQYKNLNYVIRDGVVMAESGKITYTLSM